MTVTKKQLFIIGIVLILGTKIFHFSNLFLVIGVLLVFDSLFRINNSEVEETDHGGDF